jgi:hypothetical protein
MAGRGAFVSIALAFALVLLSASVCTCLTVTLSSKSGVLTDKDRNIVYSALQAMVNNVKRDVRLDIEYNAGRLFTKYVNLMDKDVVIRLTRWSSECSVSMSSSEATEGRELLAAWKRMVPTIQNYLSKGHQWVSVSNNTDWIDYYVIRDASPAGAPPPNADAGSYMVLPDVGDCTIQPSMLLSHHSALPFSQLLPGDSLMSPDYQYTLTIPLGGQDMEPCVLNLQDADGRILWNTGYHSPLTQDNCYLAFRSDGTLELWNKNNRIWNTGSACPYGTNCAGAASLAFMDGRVKLLKSLRNNQGIYWTT